MKKVVKHETESLMEFFDQAKVKPQIVPECYDLPQGRFYRADFPGVGEIWRPSASTICRVIDSGPGIAKAIGNAHGWDAWSNMMNEKAERGTLVHELCCRMAAGQEISSLDYDEDVIKRLLSFRQFWMQHEPKIIAMEMPLIHPNCSWAGRPDLILQVQGENWLVDIKTGSPWDTYPIQLQAYAELIYRTLNVQIHRTFCLYLKEYRGDIIPEKDDKPKYQLKEHKTTLAEVQLVFDMWMQFRYKEPKLPKVWPTSIGINEEVKDEKS